MAITGINVVIGLLAWLKTAGVLADPKKVFALVPPLEGENFYRVKYANRQIGWAINLLANNLGISWLEEVDNSGNEEFCKNHIKALTEEVKDILEFAISLRQSMNV